jgi:nucleoid-associated protein YgaU
MSSAQQLQVMLQQMGAAPSLFPANSRYQSIATTTLELSDGTTIVYLLRRFVPPPQQFSVLQQHTVTQGERLDNIAAKYLGDPELYWRLCDANNAMRPSELTETVGRVINLTLPEGIPGSQNA